MGDHKPPGDQQTEQLLLTPEEAATALRVGRTTVYALMKAGELNPVHIGRSCRLSRAELERYVRRLDALQSRARRRPDARKPAAVNHNGLLDLDTHPDGGGDRRGHRRSARHRSSPHSTTPTHREKGQP
jgi:excisionase family DNA binding protein